MNSYVAKSIAILVLITAQIGLAGTVEIEDITKNADVSLRDVDIRSECINFCLQNASFDYRVKAFYVKVGVTNVDAEKMDTAPQVVRFACDVDAGSAASFTCDSHNLRYSFVSKYGPSRKLTISLVRVEGFKKPKERVVFLTPSQLSSLQEFVSLREKIKNVLKENIGEDAKPQEIVIEKNKFLFYELGRKLETDIK